MTNELQKAIAEWQSILGIECVLESNAAQEYYGPSTLEGHRNVILAGLRPETREEVIALVKIASKYKIPLYPISTGNNWGYGSASPVVDGCVVVDLSKMNKILFINDKLGLATIEPGVTTGQLEEYIEKHRINFVGPMTGAGPTCSIVGNILERGRGTNAPADRFSSLMALEAVLAGGSVYSSAFSQKNLEFRGFFKWGIGPYIDGLFGQSNLGIVVNMTIALAPKPEHVEEFLISIKKEVPLSTVIELTREALQRLGNNIPSMYIYNPQRTIIQTTPYSKAHVTEGGILSEDFIKNSLDALYLTHWTVMGTLSGDAGVVRAVRKVVKSIFDDSAEKIFFFDMATLRVITSLKNRFPLSRSVKRLVTAVRNLHSSLTDIRTGETRYRKPSLPLWKVSEGLPPDQLKDGGKIEWDYDRNPHCGLLFFSAVFPMLGTAIETFVTAAEKVCKKYRLEPTIGLFHFSDRCMRVSLPLLFDKSMTQEVHSAQQCYEELSRLSLECEGYVYRENIHSMKTMKNSAHDEDGFWQTARKIKEALDPLGIISPGRYS